uniref:Lysozyme n=1 Tax=Syphacia muris TaxID=451379 RepID=A0A0N5AMS1_9BILA
MFKLFVLFALFAVSLSSPFGFIENKFNSLVSKFSNKAAYGYAATIYSSVTPSALSCMRQAGYSAVFVRVYKPDGAGVVDYDGFNTIKKAVSAGVGVEIFVTPQPQSTKSAVTQFDEVYQAARSNNIDLRSIWLQVTSPINWPNQVTSNINFITSFLNRAAQYNLNAGIYTNWYDWQQITGGYTAKLNNVRLWYWNAYGNGITAASSLDFSDFRAFGSFSSPIIKSYSLAANVCNVIVNQNIFSNSNSKRAVETKTKSGKIIVGTI